METITEVKKRSFSLTRISEEEGLILRTLLNINDNGIKEMLQADEDYWNENLYEEEAIKIGIELRNKIMKMVDED